MERTEPDLDNAQIGPAEKPDDPLIAARRRAVRTPLVTRPDSPDRPPKPGPPSPDQEGCYFLG